MALSYYDSKDYESASTLFKELILYKDSKNLKINCDAYILINRIDEYIKEQKLYDAYMDSKELNALNAEEISDEIDITLYNLVQKLADDENDDWALQVRL